MMNYVTKREYTGANAIALSAAGVESVVTFKQAIRDLGVPGSKLKGIKACARLIRFGREKIEDENGVMKPKPIFFSVFDAKEILKRKGV